jgi:DNA-binding NarL/FixJ family response regulator
MRAAVIEDQTLMRDYLVSLLRKHCHMTEVVAIGSMQELTQRAGELKDVTLILLDIDLGDGTTLDWAVQRATGSSPGVMVAVSSINSQFPFKKLQSGGISIAHKNDSEKELVEVIQRALAGAVVISRRAMDLISAGARDPNSPLKLLGPREQQVLGLLGQRLSNDDIAAVIGCAPSTVADHRKRIMRKLDLHNIEQLIECAIQHGLVFDSTAAGVKSGRLKS